MLMKNQGFTILELMITLVIMAVLLAWGVPSFQEIIRQNRITTETNDFTTMLNLARSEAVKRGMTITVSSASGDDDWSDGYSMAVASTGEELRTAEALHSGGSLTSSGTKSSFSFNSQGYLTASTGAATLTMCQDNTTKGRSISIAGTGRVSVSTITTCP